MSEAGVVMPSGRSSALTRARNKLLRTTGYMVYKRPLEFEIAKPLVSFTFDDFPRSALHVGGAILKRHGALGTYFACTGLMGKRDATGEMFVEEDLRVVLNEGHELGCHTSGHHDAMLTLSAAFERSIVANRAELARMCPGVTIRSFSYPKAEPNLGTKRAAAQHSLCCRGGGQTFNRNRADLNCLKSFFIEQSRETPERIMRLIDENRDAPGWLIFSTHDVCDRPSPYGCTPALFDEIVSYSAASGARLLTIGAARDALLSPRANA
jgi:peptidoglycan/xylan/chitin deacetylase (PgdA/CDA1 family)